MASNGPVFDPQARYLQLDERVTNLRASVTHLEGKVDTGFAQSANAMTALGAEMRSGFERFSADLRAQQQTKWGLIWPAVAVALSFSVVIGTLAYWPIRERLAEGRNDVREIAAVLSELPETFIPRKETERLSQRGAEDRARTEAAIADLRQSTVSRNEWMERNRARDTELADLSRRVDEIRSDLGSQYTTRDVILDLRQQVEDLRRMVPPASSLTR